MKIFNYYILSEFFLCFLIIWGNILAKTEFISFCFSLTFIILFSMWFVSIYQTRKINSLLILLIVFALMNVTINAGYTLLTLVSIPEYIKKIIMMISTMLSFYILMLYKPNKIIRNYVAWMPMLMGISLIISYYFLGNTDSMAQAITLGFSNPNFTAMWLIHLFLYGAYNTFSTKKILIKIFCLIYCLLIIQLLFLTMARACIGGFFAFILLVIWGFIKRSYKLSPIVLWAILLFPLAFMLIYMGATNYLTYTNTFDMVVSEGKSITSRVGVWTDALTSFKQAWWTGNYAGVSYGTGTSQMLNIHLDILASYGVLPFILFLGLLWQIVRYFNKQLSSFSNYLAFVSFLTIILTGTFEAGLVAGCMGLNFLTSGFLVLSNSETRIISGEER